MYRSRAALFFLKSGLHPVRGGFKSLNRAYIRRGIKFKSLNRARVGCGMRFKRLNRPCAGRGVKFKNLDGHIWAKKACVYLIKYVSLCLVIYPLHYWLIALGSLNLFSPA